MSLSSTSGASSRSISWPKRLQDRITALTDAKGAFIESLREFDLAAADEFGNGDHHDEAVALVPRLGSARRRAQRRGRPARRPGHGHRRPSPDNLVPVTLEDGTETELDHGRVVIAAITSCTNTSNPSVMVGAGLPPRRPSNAASSAGRVKTSLAPGSTVVTDYLRQAGLDEYLDRLGFNLVGYGWTCIGNSGPLPEEISKVVNDNDLVVCSVLSGNRNFEGRINQDVRNNYLASPPLCVAYARWPAGWTSTSWRTRSARTPTASRSTCATSGRRTRRSSSTPAGAVRSDMFTKNYADVFKGDERCRPRHAGR